MTWLVLETASAAEHRNSELVAVHGWTADGELVYEVAANELYPPPVIEDASQLEKGTIRSVVVQRGDAVVQTWVVGHALPPLPSAKPPPLQDAEWNAWRAAHPVTAAVAGRAGAAGVRLEVRLEPAEATAPEWADGGCRLSTQASDASSTLAGFGLSATGGFWPIHRMELASPPWGGSRATEARAWWTPGGDRMALTVESESAMTMRGPVFGDLTVKVVRAAPLVAVLAPPALGAAVATRVATALGDLGAVQTGVAQAERASTVVYARAGFEAAAKDIAARVPGGATVEPMTWDAPQHVVVAVGASAR